jgi:hypothetical protein
MQEAATLLGGSPKGYASYACNLGGVARQPDESTAGEQAGLDRALRRIAPITPEGQDGRIRCILSILCPKDRQGAN